MLKLIIVTTLLLLQLQYLYAIHNDTMWPFQCDVSSHTKKYTKDNLLISPSCIQISLALLYMGAEGATAEELQKGLKCFNEFKKREDVAAEFGQLFQKLAQSKDSKLIMANRIYVDKKYEISATYNEIAAKYFDAGAEALDFGDNTKAAQAINDWVEAKTQHKIKDIMDASKLSSDSAAVLVSAIYFKAEWKDKFDVTYTKNREFHLSADKKIEVPTMLREEMFVDYVEMPGFEAIRLPYVGTDIQMLIIRPNKVDGIHEFLEGLSLSTYTQMIEAMKPERLDVYLPKFKIEFDIDLVEDLKELGMSKMFSETADLSGMIKSKLPLSISDVRHKTFIEVNEQGTEAAGATYIHAKSRSARRDPKTFKVDHPFLFGLVDSNGIYFCGHVTKL